MNRQQSLLFQRRSVTIRGMKSLPQRDVKLIRKWQAGEKTAEVAKKFEETSAMLSDSSRFSLDEDVAEIVHEINNFIHVERLATFLSSKK